MRLSPLDLIFLAGLLLAAFAVPLLGPLLWTGAVPYLVAVAGLLAGGCLWLALRYSGTEDR